MSGGRTLWSSGALLVSGLLAGLLAATGCSSYEVIPKRLEPRVNTNLAFEDLKANASRHRGELVVLGGEVLGATRLKDKTRLEVLQLPLTEEKIPRTERTESKGRFYAYDSQGKILDPAQVPEGTPITIVGEVTGTTTGTIDEAKAEVPTIEIKDLTQWDKRQARAWPYYGYPYYGGYYYHGFRPYGMLYP